MYLMSGEYPDSPELLH